MPAPTSVFATKPFATQGQVGHFDPSRLVRPFLCWESSIVLKPGDKGLSAPGQRMSPLVHSARSNRTILAATGSIDQCLQLANGPTKIAQVTQELPGGSEILSSIR